VHLASPKIVLTSPTVSEKIKPNWSVDFVSISISMGTGAILCQLRERDISFDEYGQKAKLTGDRFMVINDLEHLEIVEMASVEH
jgi:hypothetical protein